MAQFLPFDLNVCFGAQVLEDIKTVRVDGFYVCSQWWKQKFDSNDRMLINWLVSLENDRK